MAKMYGLGGVLSGKLGNTVLAVYNGVQVARQYQPIVANPKSAGQLAQRAKGNLVGRLSSFVPKAAIFGLGGNSRARRGEFLREALKAARVTSVGGQFVAKIDNFNLLFSKGATRLSVWSPVLSAVQNFVSVTLTGTSASAMTPEEYASMVTRLVVVVYRDIDNKIVEVSTRIAVKPDQGQTAVTGIPIAFEGGFTANVYAIPMSTADGSAISIDTDLAYLDDQQIAAALTANSSSLVFSYGQSLFMGTTSFTPAP